MLPLLTSRTTSSSSVLRTLVSASTTTTAKRSLYTTPTRLCPSSNKTPSSTSTSPTMPHPATNVNFEPPTSMQHPNPHLSPVLESLLERNRNWSSGFAESHPTLLSDTAKGQQPKVCWIGCSDSRVPEGSVCQTYPGEIFTIRNVANQWSQRDDSTDAALTFAIEALGVEDIIVVGHTSCGGISAAATASETSPSHDDAYPPSTSLGRYLVPLTRLAWHLRKSYGSTEISKDEFTKRLTTENVKKQLENLRESEVIKRNWKDGKSTLVEGKVCKKVKLHGWVHDIATGQLHDLNISVGPPS